MERKKRLCGYYNYTVILTYIGMISGFAGIVTAINGSSRYALLYLMISGACDMFDGTIAATRSRNTNEKRFGIQIDSLSDLICFGILPAVIVYIICGKNNVIFVICCAYVLCALIRLAYYNVLEEEKQEKGFHGDPYYLGLPVTAAALILPIAFVLGNILKLNMIPVMAVVLAVVAVAFILPFKVRKPRMAGKLGIVITGAAEFAGLVIGIGFNI